jgi:hypothetical protein
VGEYLKKKFVKSQQVEQACLDLLCSVEFYRLKFAEIECFACFLGEKYSEDDLIFYLFTRAILEKTLAIEIYNEPSKKI